MTKEEKIKDVLGDLYQYADNNGWIPFAFGITRSLKDSDLHKARINDKLVIRPKTLQGIENNNGWIKIESEDYLPKEMCKLHVYPAYLGSDIFYFYNEDLHKCELMDNHTHYQPIQKPKPPIY